MILALALGFGAGVLAGGYALWRFMSTPPRGILPVVVLPPRPPITEGEFALALFVVLAIWSLVARW